MRFLLASSASAATPAARGAGEGPIVIPCIVKGQVPEAEVPVWELVQMLPGRNLAS